MRFPDGKGGYVRVKPDSEAIDRNIMSCDFGATPNGYQLGGHIDLSDASSGRKPGVLSTVGSGIEKTVLAEQPKTRSQPRDYKTE